MRPKSSSVNKFIKKINNERNKNVQVFEENEILELNIQKCADIGIDVKEHMILKFKEYCNSKCKNRCVDLTENFLGLNSIKFLGNILYNSDRISKLNLSKNNLGDAGIEILINAIKDSKSLITLNIASNGITYTGGEIIFKNLINQQSIIDFNVCTVDGFNRNRNRLTYSGIKDIIPFLKHNLFIEYFNLSGNSIKNEGFIAVCKGLNENRSLL
jgi:Ran GTPase-activating protein (RanGAP) involved in mRNA processing and transport